MSVAWIGFLPPPVHGASLVTARLLARVRERVDDVRVVDIAGAGNGWRRHLSRLRAHVAGYRVIRGLPEGSVVYLTASGRPAGLLYQVPLVALARRRGLRTVLHHHSYVYVVTRTAVMAVIARLLGPDDAHVFLAAAMRDRFLAQYRTLAGAHVLSNAHVIDAPDLVVRAPRRPGPRLVHVSNLSVQKGSVAAIAVCHAIAVQEPGVSLTLVGPCTDDATAAALRDAGERVRWVGRQPTSRVYDELDAADVFVFGSEYPNEAEPLVVLEALSRGVPVVATRRGALPEVLPAEWLADSSDPADLAARVLTITASTPLYRAARARARAAFEARRDETDPMRVVLGVGTERSTVLQVLPTFDPAHNGPASAARQAAECYSYLPDVAVTTVGGGSAGPAWSATRTISVTRGHPSLPLLGWLLRHARRYDVVHVHAQRRPTSLWVPLLLRAMDVPYVVQTHRLCSPARRRRSAVMRALVRYALRHARAVCVVGADEHTEVSVFEPAATLVVVRDAVRGPTPEAVARGDILRGLRAPRLLFCARLHPGKGLTRFLEVVERLAPMVPGLEGHVIGPDEGALAAARARVESRGLPVRFHGALEPDDVERWMAACDVLLHPAPHEPFGFSMLEALAAGLPLVASASSALAPLFAHEGAALLPADGSVPEWVDAVGQVLADPVLADRLRAGGRVVLDRHFSVASLARSLAEVITVSTGRVIGFRMGEGGVDGPGEDVVGTGAGLPVVPEPRAGGGVRAGAGVLGR